MRCTLGRRVSRRQGGARVGSAVLGKTVSFMLLSNALATPYTLLNMQNLTGVVVWWMGRPWNGPNGQSWVQVPCTSFRYGLGDFFRACAVVARTTYPPSNGLNNAAASHPHHAVPRLMVQCYDTLPK
jgi:hypothetical protein